MRAAGRIAPSTGKQPAPQFLGLRNRCGALAVYLREELLSIEAHADLEPERALPQLARRRNVALRHRPERLDLVR